MSIKQVCYPAFSSTPFKCQGEGGISKKDIKTTKQEKPQRNKWKEVYSIYRSLRLALPNTSYSTSIKGTWNNILLTLYELRVVHIVFKC